MEKILYHAAPRLARFVAPATVAQPLSRAVLGDVELRGANTSNASGSYCEFVGATINHDGAMTDAAIAPP